MKRLLYFFLMMIILMLCSISCAKEDGYNNRITGEWHLLSFSAVTSDRVKSDPEIAAFTDSIESINNLNNYTPFSILFYTEEGEAKFALEYIEDGSHQFAMTGKYSYLEDKLSLSNIYIEPEFRDYFALYFPDQNSNEERKTLDMELSGNILRISVDATKLYQNPKILEQLGFSNLPSSLKKIELKATYSRQ